MTAAVIPAGCIWPIESSTCKRPFSLRCKRWFGMRRHTPWTGAKGAKLWRRSLDLLPRMRMLLENWRKDQREMLVLGFQDRELWDLDGDMLTPQLCPRPISQNRPTMVVITEKVQVSYLFFIHHQHVYSVDWVHSLHRTAQKTKKGPTQQHKHAQKN